MNKDNLIPGAHKLTQEDSRLGGIRSGISRREKKRALEIAREILSLPTGDGDPVSTNDISSLKDASEVTTDVMTSILATMARKAIDGDVQACKTLLTVSGDYTTKQEATVSVENNMYDSDHTKHIIHIGQEYPSHEVRYYDNDWNLVKSIYGEEAERIINNASEERRSQGKYIDFEIHSVNVVDEEGSHRVYLDENDE